MLLIVLMICDFIPCLDDCIVGVILDLSGSANFYVLDRINKV